MRDLFLLSALIVILNGLFVPNPVLAHDFWLEPSSYELAPGAPLAISFREGHGEGTPLPRNDRRLDRFEIFGSESNAPLAGVDGAHPAGVARDLEPGWYVAAYANTPAPHTLPARRFESYLEEKGLEKVSRLRAERGESEQMGRERFYRCAKTLVWVGKPELQATKSFRTDAVGLPLEIVAASSPATWRPGQSFPVRLLFRGEPLEGAKITAVWRGGDDEPEPVSVRTDSQGRALIPLNEAGRWRLQAVHMERVQTPPEGIDADWESWWASLTFQVPEPPAD